MTFTDHGRLPGGLIGVVASVLLALWGLGLPASAQNTVPGTGNPASCRLSPIRIYRKVAPSVVQVLAYGIDPFRVANRVRAQTGSGFSIGDNRVVTNFHVVAGATTIAVTGDGLLLQARVIARDPVLDIALLSVPGIASKTQPIEFAHANGLVVGQRVYVVGYPLGIGKSMTHGMISGLGRTIPLNTSSWLSPYIQTDAAVSGGNSGGPLVNDCGRMIGMVALRSQNPKAENMGYAIPTGTLRRLLPELIKTRKVARPWHGLYGRMTTPLIDALMGLSYIPGFLVETVEPGSAADKAGIKGGSLPIRWGMQQVVLGGDIITAVNGVAIRTINDAISAVRNLKIGQTVKINFVRQGRRMEASAEIKERPILERDIEPYLSQ